MVAREVFSLPMQLPALPVVGSMLAVCDLDNGGNGYE